MIIRPLNVKILPVITSISRSNGKRRISRAPENAYKPIIANTNEPVIVMMQGFTLFFSSHWG